MMYPLVRDLAADGIPVAVTCRVLGFSTQAFYKWQRQPGQRPRLGRRAPDQRRVDIHADDPEFGYRFIADELAGRGITAGANRVWRLCTPAADLVGPRHEARPQPQAPGPPVHDDLVAARVHRAGARTGCG